ncbi:MAG TPA: glucose-6-phosphate isomerase [Campylobacterales bacterium]|nr:glucose-6-phosphate isomerase [Campylobacterales bacterium]
MKNYLFFDEVVSEKEIFSKVHQESGNIGFYSLPEQDISDILNFARTIQKSTIVVIGIGGSSLGAEAVYSFLNPKYHYPKRLLFLDTTDPIALSNTIQDIDISDALFLAISKSGTTIETISVLKYLDAKIEFDANSLVVITDKDSPLEEFGKSRNLHIFNIPQNVGGRFSVLSVVGLLPLALVGVDIAKLLQGAKEVKDNFFIHNDKNHIVPKALFYSRFAEKYCSNVLFSYSELFRDFNSWFVQLWAESLGKKRGDERVGLTPIGLIGPKDQHSFLQLIMEGPLDKSVTFLKILDFGIDTTIPNHSLPHLEKLDILNGRKFSELINLQADSTIEALRKIGVPVDVIEIDRVDEVEIGKLIYYYELLTAVTAIELDINCYNQPGVELGKQILKSKLAKS